MVPLPKRYLPIAVFTGLAAVAALIGYLFPPATQAVPVRILFDNAGGKVVFDHERHARGYKLACERCHHESPEAREQVRKCSTCHGIVFDENFRKTHTASIKDPASCVTCHHMEFKGMSPKWDHEAHKSMADCRDCHHKDTAIEPEPQKCADCHAQTGDAAMPSLRDAAHARCNSCHQDLYAEKLKGCASCHEPAAARDALKRDSAVKVSPQYADCTSCHAGQKTEDLIPERMAAFHKGCMGCHEETAKGPYKKDQCNQCHTK